MTARTDLDRDGYAILPGFASLTTCAALRARMDELVAAFDPAGLRTVFSTTDQSHGRDRYFLESGGTVRFFFEPDAFDEQGELRQPKELSLNKVGHALHDLDPVFAAFSRSDACRELAASLGMERPLLLQSMYIFKQPRIGGEVTCHQDATFLCTEPSTVLGFWLALEDATVENGCMWAAPGGHRGPLRQRFVRDGDVTRMVTLDATPMPATGLVPLEVPAGTLIVLHGLLPHLSGANRSSRSRHAFALHLIDGTAVYPADNWLQRDQPPTGF